MVSELNLEDYQPDQSRDPVVAFHLCLQDSQREVEQHFHRKGQLILALHGGITCEVENALWMIPPQFAVWLPSGLPHSNRATAHARLCFLFIEPDSVKMPEHCCSLQISPLVRELILSLANRKDLAPERTQRLIATLFDELPEQPQGLLQLPVSSNPKIRRMVQGMEQAPEQSHTLKHWAAQLAMTERTLSRLIRKETGQSFRQWRQQLQVIQATRALIDGMTVQQTAAFLGYDSTTAFITMFKQVQGQTPGRYLESLYTQ